VISLASKFLLLFKPFQRFTFEIKKPAKKPSFKRKLAWTFGILALYLAMLNIPIVGVPTEGGTDPFFAMRAILASQRGSLAELGIGPIVTAGLIMQLLVGSQIIKVDFTNSEERALYTGTQKILAVLMTIFEALAYILGGAYGEDIAFGAQMIILLQLVVAGFIIMCGYPFPFLILGRQFVLLILTVGGLTIFWVTLLKFTCSRCINFSCLLNRVRKETVDEYLKRNPTIREAWERKVKSR